MRSTLVAATLAALALPAALAAPAPRGGPSPALVKRKALRLKHIESQSTNRAAQQETLEREAKASHLAAAFATSNAYEDETTTAPKDNIWASLTAYEASQVVEFLHNQTELNLTASADAGR